MKKLPKNAEEVMVRRYSLRNEKGEAVETPEDILRRSARVVSEAENNFRDGVTPEEVEAEFGKFLTEMRMVPNGRTLANAGAGSRQLANCFVLPLDDDLGKSDDGIFSILRKAVLVLQSGGGVGFSFGRIRPKGDVAGKGKATGAVSFLKVFDTAFWIIGQGGGRRSACMAVLPVHHPDIFEFIRCKEQEGVIEHFNISVGVTDAFMEAVEKNKPFDLINPRNGEVWETVDARELFDEIVKYAHHNGEPGMLFLDAANRDNPVPHQYELEATNPCFAGETRIPTNMGLLRIEELARIGTPLTLVVDSRTFADEAGSKIVEASPAFVTGVGKKVYELETKKGYRVRVTDDHKFYVGGGVYNALKDLRVGDAVYLQSAEGVWSQEWALPNRQLFDFEAQRMTLGGSVATRLIDRYPNIPQEWTRELGVILGWLVGDGWITRKSNSPLGFAFGKGEVGLEGLELVAGAMKRWFSRGTLVERKRTWQLTFGKTPADFFASLGVVEKKAAEKRVPEAVFSAPSEAVVGFLQGLFSADGTVQISKEKQYCSVRLASSSRKLLEDVQLLLLNFGIVSSVLSRRKGRVKLMPNGRGGKSAYQTNDEYELIIGKANRDRFAKVIGFASNTKQKKLNAFMETMVRRSYAESFVDKVKRIEFVGKRVVYDITEPETHSLIGQGLVTHNCGEQWLGPYENCCMASINLAEHVKKLTNGKRGRLFDKVVDWKKLKETVHQTVRWLDDVVEANQYVPAVPQLREAAHKNRRIGVSLMGLADLYYRVGVRYGSDEAVDLAGQLMEFIRFEAMRASVELARERGAFPGIKGSIYDFAKVQMSNDKVQNWKIPKPIHPYKHEFGRPELDWKGLKKTLKKHGIRNSCQTTIQPTGAIATIAGLEGYGCEPVFALSYVMKTHEGAHEKGDGDWSELYYESGAFAKAMRRSGLTKKEREAVFEIVRSKGSCQEVKLVPKEIRDVFVVSSDVVVEEHVRMQAALQAFTDNAISKTINFPATATPEDVREAYFQGWKLGLKGMTVYVTGSRETVVLETKETRSKRKVADQQTEEPFAVNGNGYVGKTLQKMKPEEWVCPECGAQMVIAEGCVTCPQCAFTLCTI